MNIMILHMWILSILSKKPINAVYGQSIKVNVAFFMIQKVLLKSKKQFMVFQNILEKSH